MSSTTKMVSTLSEHFYLPTPNDTPCFPDDPSPSSYANHSTSWTPIDSSTPISTNPSRKRSRDDNSIDPNSDGSYFPSVQQVNTPAPIPEEEPVYGEGMTLINPSTGHSISAESQTGTWFEEKAEQETAAAALAATATSSFQPQPFPPSRKAMRMSQSSLRPQQQNEDFSATAPGSPSKSSATHSEADEATLALGIGWTKMATEDESMQAAARGWAKYLDNHYARYIHNSEVVLKSSGLNAYLVSAQEGFFLFREDLSEGRLVGTTWKTCLNNLRSSPVQFEAEDVLQAERTPVPEAHQRSGFFTNHDNMNITNSGGGSEKTDSLAASLTQMADPQNGTRMDLD